MRLSILAIVLTGMLSVPFLAAGESAARPPVVLITVEATRADHVPCLGYGRNTTPNLCGLAEDGVL
ncbi:MAG: hypothetical protein ABEK12_02995, partial [Candidatus Nanohaloarchaea archaeon]